MEEQSPAQPTSQADQPGPADASPMAAAEIAATVEAILFASDSPLTASKIAQVAEIGGQKQIKTAIIELNERYEQSGCAFRIDEIAGGYQMLTLPQYHDVISRLMRVKSDAKLSQAAMETLAIVAYRQPILRADTEAIRGVACGEMLRGLMDKQLVKIVGRAAVLGRPMLYGTTKRFLDVFGLAGLDDLPRVQELRGGQDKQNQPSSQDQTPTDDQTDESAEPVAQGETDTPEPACEDNTTVQE